MVNYWLDIANEVLEKEVILVKSAPETKSWYDKMPSVLSVIQPAVKPSKFNTFNPKVGIAHHLRYTRFGIEGVLKIPRKLFRLSYYVLHDKVNQPYEPFWVVLYK